MCKAQGTDTETEIGSAGKFPNIFPYIVFVHCDFTKLLVHNNVYNTPKFLFCALFIGQTDNLFLPKIEEREDFQIKAYVSYK